MSRKIDVSDPTKLSEEDILYLQARDRLPAGVEPIMKPGVVQMAIPDNTGNASTEPPPHGGSSIDPPSTSTATSDEYDDMTVKQLKDEVDSRNADRPEDAQLSKPSKKEDLITVLRSDDDDQSVIVGDEE